MNFKVLVEELPSKFRSSSISTENLVKKMTFAEIEMADKNSAEEIPSTNDKYMLLWFKIKAAVYGYGRRNRNGTIGRHQFAELIAPIKQEILGRIQA